MNKRIILLSILLTFFHSLWGTLYDYDVYAKDSKVYFRDSIEIILHASCRSGKYKLELEGKTGPTWNPSGWGDRELTITVTESGTYRGRIKRSQYGSWRDKDWKYATVIKDTTAPSLSIAASTSSWTSGNVTLTATATDSGSGLLSIEYSNDNISYNSVSSKVISKNSTVYFRATDKVGNISVRSYTVSNIDKSKPSFTLYSNITSSTNKNVIVKTKDISAYSGVKTTQFKDSNGSWVDVTSKALSSNGSVYCRIKNNAGTWSNVVTKIVSNIDKTPPEINFSIDPEGWTTGSVTISPIGFDADSGVKSVKLKNASNLYIPVKEIDVTSNRTLNFQVTDKAGTTIFIDYEVTNIDNTSPIINFEVGPVGWTSDSKLIKANVSDPESGILSTFYSLDNLIWILGDSVSVFKNSTVYFKTQNGAGEWMLSNYEITDIDNSKPEITLNVTPLGWTNKTKTIAAKVTDHESGIDKTLYSLDNLTWVSGEFITIDKNSTIYFKTKNKAGLWNSNSVIIQNIDPSLPLLTLKASILDNEWTNKENIISAETSDPESSIISTKYSFDNSLWITGNTVSINDNKSVFFKTENGAGSVVFDVYNIKNIDKTIPTIIFEKSPSILTNKDVVVTAIGVDRESGISEIKYQNADKSWTSSENKIFKNNGSIKFKVLNNAGSWSDVFTYNVDNIDKIEPLILNPFLNNISKVKDRLYLINEGLVASDENLSLIEYSFNGNFWRNYETDIDISNLSDGNNKIYLKGTDLAGNSTTNEYEFLKDTMSPIIEDLVLNFNDSEQDTKGNNSLILNNLIIVEENLDRYGYKIQSLDITSSISGEFSGLVSSYKSISLESLEEGSYNLEIYATDRSGNRSTKKKKFYIDRTKPSSVGVSLYLTDIENDYREYSEDDVSGFNELSMDYLTSDTEIEYPRYKFIVTKTQPSKLTNLEDKVTDFQIDSNLHFLEGNGLYYIYSFLIDDAGNISDDYVYRKIRFNSMPIPIPLISGVKEAKNLTDVISNNDPQFTISPRFIGTGGENINYGDMSIIAYEYKLFKGYNSDFEEPFLTGVVNTSDNINSYISFNSLLDNEPGEYYSLYVRAKSNTDQFSEFTNEYKFRVDTNPPEFLEVKSSSHTNSDTAYSYNYVSFYWDNPWDKTGVEKYKYSLSRDGINFTEGDIENVQINGDRQSLFINLDDEFTTGSLFLHVESIDFAGNINIENTNTLEVKIDRTVPTIKIESIENSLDTLSSIISWKSSLNTDSQKITIVTNDYEISKYLPGTVSSYNLNGLAQNQVYKVKIYGYSAATNSLVGMDSKEFRVDDIYNTLVEPISKDFTKQFNGFRVDGVINQDIVNSTAILYVPESLNFIGETGNINEINLEDVFFQKDDNDFLSGSNSFIKFDSRINGFNIVSTEESEISVDIDRGLFLTNRILKYNINDDEIVDIPFATINILSANSLEMVSSLTRTEPIDISTKNIGNESWSISDVSEISLLDSHLYLGNGSIDVSQYENLNIRNLDNIEVLEVTNSLVDTERTFLSGDIKSEFVMTFGIGQDEIKIKVMESKLIENELVILKAKVILDDGYDVYDADGNATNILLSDLRIDQNGNVIKQPFLLDSFYINHNENCSFFIDSVDFSLNNVCVNGYILSNGIKIVSSEFSGLTLTNRGISENSSGYLNNNFSFISKSGFPVFSNSQNVRITSKGYLLESGTIDLSSFKPDLKTEIYGMIVDFNYNDIIVPGLMNSNIVELTNDVSVTNLELNNENLIATKSLLYLTDFFETESVELQDMIMDLDHDSNRGFLHKAFISESISSIELRSGYIIDLKEGYYENGFLQIPIFSIQLPENSSLDKLELSNLKVNRESITYDPLPKLITYTKNGWEFHITDSYLTKEGIQGETVLNFLINSVKNSVFLDSFILKNSGDYILPKTINFSSDINIASFKALVQGITISEKNGVHSIKFDSVLINRPDKSIEFELLDLEVSSYGEILNSGSSIKPESFISENGFKVEPDGLEYRDNRLFLNGNIYIPKYLGADKPIKLDEYSIEITPSWNIFTRQILEPAILNLNGVEIEILNYFITEEGLFVPDSKVLLDNFQFLVINNSLFSSDGKILSAGNIEEKNVNLEIDGWSMIVGSAFYTTEGIELRSHVKLSEELGSPTLYFDDMRIYKDNLHIEFTSNTTIYLLEFEHHDVEFSIETIKLNQNSLSISNGDITLPKNDVFGGETINIKYFEIDEDGAFKLSGSRVSPIKIYGFDIYIDNLSFKENLLDISGAVQFPIDFGIKELASKKVSIKTLQYNFETEELIFDIELDNITIDISGEWTTEFSSISISGNGLLINRGVIKFPTDWLENISLEECGFKDLSYDFFTGEFSIREIFINNLEVECEGYEFIITSATYSGSEGFSFSGFFPLEGLFEGEETPPILIVNNLNIQNDFKITELDAGLSVNNLSLTPNEELQYSGYIGVIASDENFILDLAGVLEAGDTFEVEDFRNDKLEIETFTFNMLDKEIITLNATYESNSKEFFNTDIRDFSLGVDYTNKSEIMIFKLSGNVIVPNSFPGIGGEIFSINGEFDTIGNVYSLSSRLTLESDRPLVGDLILKSGSMININPILEENNQTSKLVGMEFSLNETEIIFSENFSIEKLQRSSIDIDKLVINTEGGFESCSLSFNTPSHMELYDDIYLENGSISLESYDDKEIITTITGDLQLPSTMGNLLISISEFSINSNGDVVIDSEASNINVNILDQVKLTNGTVYVNNGSVPGALDFEISGNFNLLSSSIPPDIRNAELIGSILYSTDKGIETFYLGLKSGDAISYKLIDGVTLYLDGLSISEKGISSVVSLSIEDGFYGLQGTTRTQGTILMDWDGKIIESDINIKQLFLKYANMDCEILHLHINQDGINFESAILQLPDSLGNKKVGIVNGGITTRGEFYGDFVVESLDIDLLGCKVTIYNPKLDMVKELITCDRAEFVLPESLGSASIGLTDVSIGSNGLSISGGSFALPDIDTGAMKFTNMFATLLIDGNDYEISANGKVFIATIGEVEARISLVNISQPEFPIGLKYAYFSFESEVGGIPLATTGLLITGVRGGLAFGPPGDDLPLYIKDKFSSGMRIQLGITIKDPSMTVTGRSDFWLNVTNLDFALKGELEFLNGLFSSNATALYTKSYGIELKAGLEISLIDKIILDGMLRAHIFREDGGSKFCAEATVDVAVKDLIWGFPKSPVNLGTLGVEVGDFKNNRQGFKGYISLRIIGTKGFYYGTNGDFKLGNVNSYRLLDRSFGVSRSRDILSGTVNKRYSLVTNRSINSDINRERIIFCLEFSEGDPTIYAISPSGVKYSEGDDNIIVERLEDKILMAVVNPEIGSWDLEVKNLTRDSDYKVEAIGFDKNATINLNSPKLLKESSSSNFKVNGTYSVYTSESTISVYVSKERGIFNGLEIASFNPDESNSFSYELDTLNLDNGEYFIYAGVYDGENPEVYDYADGSIIINNNLSTIPGVNDLIIGTTESNTVNISFTNSQSNKVKGYYLNIINLDTDEVETLNIGYMNKLSLSSLSESDKYSLFVTPYDNNGLLGNKSNIVNIDFNGSKTVNNSFNVYSEDIILEIGNSINYSISIDPINYTESNDGNDYVELKVLDIPDFLTLKLNNNRVKLDRSNTFSTDIICSESVLDRDDNEIFTEPREYSITIQIINIGNNIIEKTLIIPVTVVYVDPEIYNISPQTWLIEEGSKVNIVGSGFTHESTVYIGDQICEVLSQNRSTLKVKVPGVSNNNSGVLSITNPDTKAGTFTPKLLRPYYSIKNIKHNTIINKGGTGWLYSKIQSYNKFDDLVDFTILDYPEDWSINCSHEIITDTNFMMEVTVPNWTENDIYNIKVQSGDIVTNYSVEVVDSYPEPTITNLSTYSGDWGDIITIYGYGFNSGVEAFYSGESVELLSNFQDSIQIRIPNNVSDGFISLKRDSLISNEAEFQIKGDSFNIYPSKDSYQILPGDSFTQTLFIRGYADFVDIEVETDSKEISATLNRSYVEPNGNVELSVSLSNQIKQGLYRVTINGTGFNNTRSEIITISVGENIDFTDKTLKSGMVEYKYNDTLEIINNLKNYTFKLTENTYLPYGLYLNKTTGEIYGTPESSGTFIFKIDVVEDEYRHNTKEFLIVIEDSGWFSSSAPIGNNRFSNIRSPGENSIIWSSDRIDSTKYLLSSMDNVYSISSSKIDALSKFTGDRIYTITGEFLDVSLKGKYILSLENRYIKEIFDDKYLVVYNAENGFEITKYKGVTDFKSSDRSYINRSGNTSNIDINNNSFEEKQTNTIFDSTVLTTADGLFNIHDNVIEKYINNEFIVVEKTDNIIEFFTTYSGQLVILDNFGNYINISTGKTINTGISNGKVIVGEEFSIVYNNSKVIIINRNTNNIIRKAVEVDELILTKDKLLILNRYGITSYNLYSGIDIWNVHGTYRSLISSGTKLYALDNSNKVICLGGRPNITPPVTKIVLSPKEPNGKNGFYTIKPELSFKVDDIESYGKTVYSINDASWLKFNKSQTLTEGNYNIKYLSYDSDGLSEEEQETSLKIDTIPPISKMIKTESASNIRFDITAEDDNSLVNKIFYEINGEQFIYTEPVIIRDEGEINLTWWSSDNAGNIENRRNLNFNLDSHTSIVNDELYNDKEISNTISSNKKSLSSSIKEIVEELIITITPEIPDGKNGFYITHPIINFNLDDSSYSVDGDTWLEYDSEFKLDDGEFELRNSSDKTKTLEIKIDSIPPETNLLKTETETGVEFKLLSSDLISKVENSYYSINGIEYHYTSPFKINTEGEYNVDFWSEDYAGNLESKKNISFSVDLYRPKVESQIDKDGRILLTATDSFSGVNRIEYRVNGSSIATYQKPLEFSEGYFNLTFRAVDKVEHESEWKNIVIDNVVYKKINIIEELLSGLVIDNTDNQLKLPDYLVDGTVLQKEQETNIKFKTGVVTDLYLINSTDVVPDKTWFLVESLLNGTDVYHKIVEKSTEVELKDGENSIVLIKNPKEDLIIFSPDVGSENWYAATELENELRRRWFYKIEDQSWVEIGQSFSGDLELPDLKNGTTYELKVEIETISPVSRDKIDLISRTRKYTISNSRGEN